MSVLPHPTPEQLTAYGLGKLPTTEADDVAAHLEQCDTCLKAVEAVPDDSLLGVIRPFVQGQPDLPTDPWIPPELLDHPRYRLIELLGAGGMGVVFKAQHRLMDRLVAIKVISKRLTQNPAAVERFKREVKAAARLDHPNVCRAYDAEQVGDLHFLVMEFIEGVNLARMIEDRGPLPVDLSCDYARQAALGLQHAWENGLTHRDVSPKNLMVTGKGQVKILDFGLAGLTSDTEDSQTEFGACLGTPSFMAPEQGQDAHSADIRSDIYSLGCCLYCFLAGRPPFSGRTVQQKIAAHREQQPSPLPRDLPNGLGQVIEKMMAKEPSQRYQTPAEVAAALAPYAGETPKKRRGWLWWLMGATGTACVLIGFRLASDQTESEKQEESPKQSPQANPILGANELRDAVREAQEKLDTIMPQINTSVADRSRRTLTRKDFDELGSFYLLERLILTDATFDEKHLEMLDGLAVLKALHLERTPVTDEAFTLLSNLQDIEELYLSGTAITDEGLENLPSTSRLRRLDVRGTKVTDKGIAALRKKVPKCNIDR